MISKDNNLKRFIDAQESHYEIALSEVKKGKKQSHWMWYIFPQIQGLGFSTTSMFYAIKDLEEAKAYLEHPVLGDRLVGICKALLNLKTNDAMSIFGSPDNMKLKSSMTLFSSLNLNPVFELVLDKFFQGKKDDQTLRIIGKSNEP